VAAEAATEPAAVAEAERAAVRLDADRAYLISRLRALPGVALPAESRASFVLVRLAGAAQVREILRERGFAVRRGDTFPGLGRDWLRIAVRDRTTTAAFVTALTEALAEARTA
jgi:histidinol-phosphate aminotransferase